MYGWFCTTSSIHTCILLSSRVTAVHQFYFLSTTLPHMRAMPLAMIANNSLAASRHGDSQPLAQADEPTLLVPRFRGKPPSVHSLLTGCNSSYLGSSASHAVAAAASRPLCRNNGSVLGCLPLNISNTVSGALLPPMASTVSLQVNNSMQNLLAPL